MAADGGLIHRSVALAAEVDDLLELLADAEGTSRSHLMREALTLLFAARGITADGQAGVEVNPAAVGFRWDDVIPSLWPTLTDELEPL